MRKTYGFVKPLANMGSRGPLGLEQIIVDAARVSYGGTRGHDYERDRSLIRYLMEHSHWSPFEMARTIWHIRAPIFVARQLMRYRTAAVNEISGRYVEFSEDHYQPDILRYQSKDNKQGSYGGDSVSDDYFKYDYRGYKDKISKGYAKEQVRAMLPLGTYTEFWMSIDLRNNLNIVKQRLDKTAQQEVRDLVATMWKDLQELYPITCEAYTNFHLDAVTITPEDLKIVSGEISVSKSKKKRVIDKITPISELLSKYSGHTKEQPDSGHKKEHPDSGHKKDNGSGIK